MFWFFFLIFSLLLEGLISNPVLVPLTVIVFFKTVSSFCPAATIQMREDLGWWQFIWVYNLALKSMILTGSCMCHEGCFQDFFCSCFASQVTAGYWPWMEPAGNILHILSRAENIFPSPLHGFWIRKKITSVCIFSYSYYSPKGDTCKGGQLNYLSSWT